MRQTARAAPARAMMGQVTGAPRLMRAAGGSAILDAAGWDRSEEGAGVESDREQVVPRSGFHHEALIYRGTSEFLAGTVPFIREALAAGEPVMLAVTAPRAEGLRDELGADIRAVTVLDVEDVGRNPARLIPTWQRWVDRHQAAETGFRGICEPVWAGRGKAEALEFQQHEALLNAAFAGGPAWKLLCPYDTTTLDLDVIERAHDTHPCIVNGRERRRSNRYASPGMFADLLPEPGATLYETTFDRDDLYRIRQVVAKYATDSGLLPARTQDLVLAVNELVANSVLHGGGGGTLRAWRDAGALLIEVHDRGLIRDPLVGCRQPGVTGDGGAGLWMANQLCDLVQIRSSATAGTTVRVHMALPVA